MTFKVKVLKVILLCADGNPHSYATGHGLSCDYQYLRNGFNDSLATAVAMADTISLLDRPHQAALLSKFPPHPPTQGLYDRRFPLNPQQ